MSMDVGEKAAELNRKGYNCAQSVLSALSECSWSIKKQPTNNTQRQPPRAIP